jgi:hypothetical protein
MPTRYAVRRARTARCVRRVLAARAVAGEEPAGSGAGRPRDAAPGEDKATGWQPGRSPWPATPGGHERLGAVARGSREGSQRHVEAPADGAAS